jgi:DNA-binding CsgD family transcriptional regulator
MSEEYRVKVSVSNNLLIRAIENAGYKNQSEFARAIGCSVSNVNMLCGLRISPMTQNGCFTDLANQVMEGLGACPTDLWTEEQLTMNLKRSSSWSVMGREELHVLMNGEQKSLLESVAGQELKKAMDDVRKTLTYREQQIIGMRFDDDKSLEECGKELKLSKERIRHIEAKALRKMRYPSRSDQLRDFVEEM